MSMTNPSIVCVLGMHRSGTSAVARILNLLGVYLGPEEHLLEARGPNPKGFWEHRQLMKLDEEILERFGGNWHEPPSLPAGWQHAPEIADLAQRAREMLHEEFSAASLWGWKDPRTCLTLPFWQTLLPSMLYVICLRSPIDVARSLERRDSFTLDKGVGLWLTYMSSTLDHTAGQGPALIYYEDLMADWRREVARLAEFIGRAELAKQPEILQAVRAFIDPELQHHHTPILLPAKVEAEGVPAGALRTAQQVYLTLRERPLTGCDEILQQLREVAEAIAEETSRRRQAEYQKWTALANTAQQEIAALIPAGGMLILVDEGRWEIDGTLAGRRCLPFVERHGQYWGPPQNDGDAVAEFERLREAGASHIVFAWPSFWWLEHYTGLHQHLRRQFRCVVENDRVVGFDLRRAAAG